MVTPILDMITCISPTHNLQDIILSICVYKTYLIVETHFLEGAVSDNRSNLDVHRIDTEIFSAVQSYYNRGEI